MKIPPLTHFCILALMPLTLMAGNPPQVDSLLPDGSFEVIDSDTGRPQGWPTIKAASWPQEDDNRFLRLQSSGENKIDMLPVRVTLPEGVEALELTYAGRVSDLKVGEKPWNDARVIVNFKNEAGELIGNGPPTYFRNSTKGWRIRKSRFLVPEETATVEILPSLLKVKRGTFDLDDIILKPIDAAELREEIARNKPAPAPAIESANPEAWPEEIRVEGNRLVNKSGKEVWLQGVNVASLEWGYRGENVLLSTKVAIEEWKANVIRLPIKDYYWFGQREGQTDGGKSYQEIVDAVITFATNRGAYVVIDLHNYRAPRLEHIPFWQDVAKRYKNHPGVLFDLLNEPHGISWEVWREGGFVTERAAGADEDNFLTDEEKIVAKLGFKSPGMQRMVEVVRETGANNVIVAGGLDYAYDLSGILKGYALEDPSGNGIMYASHIYPWKRDWQGKMLDIAEHYPILIGEVGADIKKQPWETDASFEAPDSWVPDMLGLIQERRLNWTGWCFHPKAGPRMLIDWQYTPTPFWGEPAKRALLGERFEMKKMR